MGKILITGGSGFIGTNLIESLRKANDTLLNIDIAEPKLDAHKFFCDKGIIKDV